MKSISINCGSCIFLKGCEIRKAFINTANLNKIENCYYKLNCPKKRTNKVKDGEQVEFTVAYGKHIVPYEWEDEYGNVTIFKNRRYTGNVTLKGEIKNYLGKKNYLILVDENHFYDNKGVFNEVDLKIIKEISSKFEYAELGKIAFVSKEKFIKQ